MIIIKFFLIIGLCYTNRRVHILIYTLIDFEYDIFFVKNTDRHTENKVRYDYTSWEFFVYFDLKNHLMKFDTVITGHLVYWSPVPHPTPPSTWSVSYSSDVLARVFIFQHTSLKTSKNTSFTSRPTSFKKIRNVRRVPRIVCDSCDDPSTFHHQINCLKLLKDMLNWNVSKVSFPLVKSITSDNLWHFCWISFTLYARTVRV